MWIEIDGEDAEKLRKIGKVLGGEEKAVSFSLGLCHVALGIDKLDVLLFLRPRPPNQPREPPSDA